MLDRARRRRRGDRRNPGLALATTCVAGALDRRQLALADAGRRARVAAWSRRRRRRSTALRRRARPHRRPPPAPCAPAGERAARGGDGTDPARSPGRAVGEPAAGRSSGATNSLASRTRALNALASLGSEEMPVVLERGATARRVDHDRSVARHRCRSPAAPVASPRRSSRRGCASAPQHAAARAGDLAGDTDGGEHLGGVAVRVALPRVHHASGEQPRVVAGRRHWRRRVAAATWADPSASAPAAAR